MPLSGEFGGKDTFCGGVVGVVVDGLVGVVGDGVVVVGI